MGAPERDAARKLEAYLLSRPVQERAMTAFGFRPQPTDIALGAPIDVGAQESREPVGKGVSVKMLPGATREPDEEVAM